MADLLVSFDMTDANLTYTAATNALTVDEISASDLRVYLKNTALSPDVRDTAMITGGDNFDLLLSLTLTDLPGTDNWSGSGSLTFTDSNTNDDAVVANLETTSINIFAGGGGILWITGDLTDVSGGILQNRGDPWKFVGTSAIGGYLDADGVPGQISVSSPDNYDIGVVLVLEFGTPTTSEDVFFGSNRNIGGGNVKGSIVPAPAAVLLGMMGLGIVGIRMRRLA